MKDWLIELLKDTEGPTNRVQKLSNLTNDAIQKLVRDFKENYPEQTTILEEIEKIAYMVDILHSGIWLLK